MPFQTIPGFDLQISAGVVSKCDSAMTPATMVTAGQPWGIDVEWSIGGRNACLLGGTWVVRAFVDAIGEVHREQVGGAVEVAVKSAPPLSAPRSYRATIAGPATVPANLYRVTAVVKLENEGVPVPFTGLADGGILEIYAPR